MYIPAQKSDMPAEAPFRYLVLDETLRVAMVRKSGLTISSDHPEYRRHKKVRERPPHCPKEIRISIDRSPGFQGTKKRLAFWQRGDRVLLVTRDPNFRVGKI